MNICKGLDCIRSINVHNIWLETYCLEVVHLFNGVSMNLSEAFFFIEEAKSNVVELG